MNHTPSTARGSKAGFTLIEMLITTALFAFFSVVITTAYFAFLQTNMAADAQRSAAEDAAATIARIEQFARGTIVDEAYYTAYSPSMGTTDLVLRGLVDSNIRYTFRYQKNPTTGRGRVFLTVDRMQPVLVRISGPTPVSPQLLDITDMRFYLSPMGGNTAAPRITTSLAGTWRGNSFDLPVQMQSSVMPRNMSEY